MRASRDLRYAAPMRSEDQGEGAGLAAVAEAFEKTEFPISRADLVRWAADRRIEPEPGRSVALRDLVEGYEDDTIPSLAFLLAHVKQVLRDRGGGAHAAPPA